MLQLVAIHGEAPVDAPATRAHIGRETAPVAPEDATGFGIERGDIVRRLGDVHDAVDDERRGLDLRIPRLVHPLQLEPMRVGRRDLVETAEAPTAIVPRIGEPTPRLVVGIEQPFVGDLSRDSGREETKIAAAFLIESSPF